MSSPGENEQSRAPLTSEAQLEWQSELDSALAELDSRLSHPRRRASDTTPQAMPRQVGQVVLTTELLDELAWRVSEQIRRGQNAVAASSPAAATLAMPYGISIVIRLRKPLFSWRFWRRRSRRRQSMVALSDMRV
jgi:hypothetical protein